MDSSTGSVSTSDTTDGEREQPPSLDELEDDELIRCQNPNYEHLTWFYGLDSDGNVRTYHQFNDFDLSTDTDQERAESSITADRVNTTIVGAEELAKRQSIGGDA